MNKEELHEIFSEQTTKSSSVMFMISTLKEVINDKQHISLQVLTTESDKIDELLDNELVGYEFESYVNDIPKFVKQ